MTKYICKTPITSLQTMKEVSELSEQVYSGLTRLMATLAVFKSLQKAALHDENYEYLETLELLHRDLFQQCEILDEQAAILRKSVDPQQYNNAWILQASKTLHAERADQRTETSA